MRFTSDERVSRPLSTSGLALILSACGAPVKNLKLKVLPKSASIYVNGQSWMPATGEVQELKLDFTRYPEQQIQIVAPGYRPERLTYTIEEVPGGVVPINLR